MKKNLIYGGTGTTGRTLVEILKQSDLDFTAGVTSEEKVTQFANNNVDAILAPLGDWKRVDEALPKVDTVFLLTS